MIRHVHPRKHARRGAILLVVLGMLALFAVVGLSFVLYAESEATGARNNRAARNELADPDPAGAANGFLTQLIFGTNDPSSGLYYQDLATSRFGPAGLMNQTPFNGSPYPVGTLLPWTGNAQFDQTQLLNYGWAVTAAAQASATFTPQTFNKAVPWTYPDRNNAYLAYYDPVTDQVTVPSYFRPDLFGSLAPNNPNWSSQQGRFMILRPRPIASENPQFPTVPANADGTYTGDVANLKFLTGSQRNDSLWMDVGLPIKQWRGKSYKPLIAPLILDLGGKLNLTVAGNNRGLNNGNGSHHGWGPWEMNPTALLPNGQADLTNLLALRYTGTVTAPALPATGLNKFTLGSIGVLNGGLTGSAQMPPQYSQFSPTGLNSNTPAADAMTLPAAGMFSPFPNYPTTTFAPNQAQLAIQLSPGGGALVHGQTYSPYQYLRQTSLNTTTPTPYVPSMEDQLRMQLPFGGPKGTSVLANLPNTFGNPAILPINPNRKNSTLFSVSQRWGEIVVNQTATPVKLAAIDLTRPLPDYRISANGPLSPANISPATLVAARVARQNLARDIFVRLAAANNLVDGTTVAYSPTTGYLTFGAMPPAATMTQLQFWAQYAANMVDQIDNDDIVTTFVWNPSDPTQPDVNDTSVANNQPNFAPTTIAQHTVLGTEVPRLVLNEAYCELTTQANDTPPFGPPPNPGKGGMKTTQNSAQKAYWLELVNPLPAVDPTLSDAGSARLEYDPAVTQVFDGTTNAMIQFNGGKYAAYIIEIADIPAPAMPPPQPTQPYTTFLQTGTMGTLGVLADTVATPIPGMTTYLRVNDYTNYNPYGNGAMPAAQAAQMANDALKQVIPVAGANAGNAYFVIGPRASFPTPGVTQNLLISDPPATIMPMTAANAMAFNVQGGATQTDAQLTQYAKSTSAAMLRRLLNPYLPPQNNPAVALYNPYMTVDYLENIPTRDRAQFSSDGPRAGNDSKPSIGRKHPYAAAPCYNPQQMAAPFPAILDQAGAAMNNNPPTTFGAANNPVDNNNAGIGYSWLAHLDREPVNQFELLHTSAIAPGVLTQQFYDGTLYQKHISPYTAAGTMGVPPLLDVNNANFNFTYAYRALDLLSVSSRLPGVPLGGREPGRVNINTAGDFSLMQALLDPQSGDTFFQNAAYTPLSVWTSLMSSRTNMNTFGGGAPSNQPIATVYENGSDRPYVPFGAITPSPNVSLYSDSFLRSFPLVAAPYPNLALFNTGPGTNGHPYMMSEPLRKVWNNVTTVSDGFLVVFTVGFFEVSPSGAPAGSLGKELFDKVPGDLRAQYAGIVDRSALTLPIDPTAATLAIQPGQLGPKPWETKTVGDATIGATTITVQAQATAAGSCTVFSEGVAVTIDATGAPPTASRTSQLWVGYSMANPSSNAVITTPNATLADGDGEAIKVTAVAQGPIPGTATLTIQTVTGAGFQRFHGGGSRVSNAVLGNPGPQPSFNYRETTGMYNGVLPFFMRMLP